MQVNNTAAPATVHTTGPATRPFIERRYLYTTIAYIVLAVMCFALDIAGVTTALFTIDGGNADTVDGSVTGAPNSRVTTSGSTTLWQSCSKLTSGSVTQQTCSNVDDSANGCTLDRIKAMRAFGIMAILLAFIICICAVVADLFGVLPWHMSRWMLAGAAFLLMVFHLIYWAIMAGLWNNGCGTQTAFKNFAGSKYGPSGPLFIVSWILSLVMMVLPVAMEPTHTAKVVANDPMAHHTAVIGGNDALARPAVVATDAYGRPVVANNEPMGRHAVVTVPR